MEEDKREKIPFGDELQTLEMGIFLNEEGWPAIVFFFGGGASFSPPPFFQQVKTRLTCSHCVPASGYSSGLAGADSLGQGRKTTQGRK